MTPKEFEEWLNDRMDYYSNKAIEAGQGSSGNSAPQARFR
jgi:hypothetical protein